jgi:aryl-alcohol dehydrogenase-like predicted oxidoreductase
MKYKLFGNSGLRVSELCLGTMSFGTEWGWGCDYEESKQIFEQYANRGGNFIDTANRYTEGTSELYLSDFLHADRDHFVLATKYSLYDKREDPNYQGNHRKNMIRSVENSLKRLKTDFIDLLWVHAWDFTTPVEEVMRGLDDLVRSGKVHYIGVSDTPAWIVAQANTMADLRGWTKFSGLQVEYSLIERTAERDLLPMAKAFDLAVTPWGPLGGGVLTGKYLRGEQGRIAEDNPRRSERNEQIARTVVEIADELDVSPGQVAINWLRQQKNSQIIPLIGASKPHQIKDSMNCLSFRLEDEHIKRLAEVSQVDLGFPHEFLQKDAIRDVMFGGTYEQIEFRE